jgi:hypothetical protein
MIYLLYTTRKQRHCFILLTLVVVTIGCFCRVAGVQHYCYLKSGEQLARHFYTQWESYQYVNVAVDWTARAMYVYVAFTEETPIRNLQFLLMRISSRNSFAARLLMNFAFGILCNRTGT